MNVDTIRDDQLRTQVVTDDYSLLDEPDFDFIFSLLLQQQSIISPLDVDACKYSVGAYYHFFGIIAPQFSLTALCCERQREQSFPKFDSRSPKFRSFTKKSSIRQNLSSTFTSSRSLLAYLASTLSDALT